MPHKIKKTTSEFKKNPGKFPGGMAQAIASGLEQDRKSHRGTKAAPKQRRGR